MPERGGYAGYGMCIGLCLGLSVGLACGQMVIGMAAGMCLGLAAGAVLQCMRKNRTAAGRKSAYFQEIKEGQKAALFCFPTGMPRRHWSSGACGDFWDRVGYQRRPLPCGKGLISVPAMEEKRTSRCCRWKSIHSPFLR